MENRIELIAYTKFLKELSQQLFQDTSPTELVDKYDEFLIKGKRIRKKIKDDVCDHLLKKRCCTPLSRFLDCPFFNNGKYRDCYLFKEGE